MNVMADNPTPAQRKNRGGNDGGARTEGGHANSIDWRTKKQNAGGAHPGLPRFSRNCGYRHRIPVGLGG